MASALQNIGEIYLPTFLEKQLHNIRRGDTRLPFWTQYLLYRAWGKTITDAEKHAGALFIHIPKNAGWSISQTLFNQQVGHRALQTLKRYEGGSARKLFTFAFVRNPWDRFLSTYKFLMQGGKSRADHLWAQSHLARYTDFAEFVEALNNPAIAASILQQKHFRSQCFWIEDKHGNINIDYLGKFEKLEEDFQRICSRIGIQRKLPHLNRSSHKEYPQHYNHRTARIIHRLYSRDIESFGYSFN